MKVHRALLVIAWAWAWASLVGRAHATVDTRIDLGGTLQHVEAQDASLAVVGALAIEGEHRLPSATPAQPTGENEPSPWLSRVRGSLLGEALVATDRLRGRLQGRALAEVGYLVVATQLSYGQRAAFADRYWRSGRDLWLPGLGLGGRGWRWRRGPSDVRALSWLAEVETQVRASDAGTSWDARTSTNLGATLGIVTLERSGDQHELRLDGFVGHVRRYGTGRLLDFSIDVVRFRSQPRAGGWGADAALGMSALRLTPGPRAVGPDTPGQATPKARLVLWHEGAATTAELGLATFHRIDPSGTAIDRGGLGQARVRLRLGQRWQLEGAGDLVVARRVRVGDALSPTVTQFHDWLSLYQLSSAIRCDLGGSFDLVWRGWIEHSDRDDALRLPSAPIRAQRVLGVQLGLSWRGPPQTDAISR
jgi:hypothetical protein